MALPYRAHPLYHLRKALIVTDIIGIILSVLLIGPYGPSGDGSIPFWLAISAPVKAADLVFYATKKLADPDNNPPWPRKLWVIGDILLAIILQIVFWAAIASLSWRYSYGGDAIFGAYAALACFIASLLHAYCFWKQLKAYYKSRWLAGLKKEPCARCGYSEVINQQGNVPRAAPSMPTYEQSTVMPPNIFGYAGPSATYQDPNLVTPESSDSAMEEGLLIGSDFSTGYGSISHPECTLEQPDEVVVGGKGKKKAGRGGKNSGKKPALDS